MSNEELEIQARVCGWDEVSYNIKLTEEQIDKYSDRIDWIGICRHQKLTPKLIDKYSDITVWHSNKEFYLIPLSKILIYSENWYWRGYAHDKNLDITTKNKCIRYICWFEILMFQDLTTDQLIKYNDKLNMVALAHNKYLIDKLEFRIFYD